MNDYSTQWAAYLTHKGKIVRLLLLELAAFFPSLFLIAYLQSRQSPPRSLVVPAIYAWLPILLITAFRLRFFPCPRCGKNYFGGVPSLFNPVLLIRSPRAFAGWACVHCGLRKFADS